MANNWTHVVFFGKKKGRKRGRFGFHYAKKSNIYQRSFARRHGNRIVTVFQKKRGKHGKIKTFIFR